MSGTDALMKEGYTGRCCKLVDEFELEEGENCIWSNKGEHRTLLVAEALVTLCLVKIGIINMKHADEGSIIAHVSCEKVLELLTANALKLSQSVRDSSAIISKIIELEKYSNEYFEHVRMRKKRC